MSPSFFPAAEAPSFCSRRTPVVPPNDDLRSFGLEAFDSEGSGPRNVPSPSSRPTMGPGELEPVRGIASDRPTYTPDEVLVEMLERATIGTPVPAPVHEVKLPDVAPPARVTTRRGRGRALVSYGLFTVLFGGVLGLLGYAMQPKLLHVMDVVRARVVQPSVPGR